MHLRLYKHWLQLSSHLIVLWHSAARVFPIIKCFPILCIDILLSLYKFTLSQTSLYRILQGKSPHSRDITPCFCLDYSWISGCCLVLVWIWFHVVSFFNFYVCVILTADCSLLSVLPSIFMCVSVWWCATYRRVHRNETQLNCILLDRLPTN